MSDVMASTQLSTVPVMKVTQTVQSCGQIARSAIIPLTPPRSVLQMLQQQHPIGQLKQAPSIVIAASSSDILFKFFNILSFTSFLFYCLTQNI
jgi:hypothetical protein